MEIANENELIETASAVITRTQYQTIVSSANHTLIADEPPEAGGTDTGMSPYSLLLASLGSCTAITLRMYINRKMWPIDEIKVDCELYKTDKGTLIERQLSFKGDISSAQKDRLLYIANACPIHKILTGNIDINTKLV